MIAGFHREGYVSHGLDERRAAEPVGARARPARRARHRAADGRRRRTVRGGRRAHGAADRLPRPRRRRLHAGSRDPGGTPASSTVFVGERPPGVDRGAGRGRRVGRRSTRTPAARDPRARARPAHRRVPPAVRAAAARRSGPRSTTSMPTPTSRSTSATTATNHGSRRCSASSSVAGFVVLGLACWSARSWPIIVAKLRRRRLRRRAPTAVERIEGGWQEFADTAADYGYPIRPTRRAPSRRRPSAGSLRSCSRRSSIGPCSRPTARRRRRPARLGHGRRAAGAPGRPRTRRERLRAAISLSSLGGYAVTRRGGQP